jgi:hypothetical protein
VEHANQSVPVHWPPVCVCDRVDSALPDDATSLQTAPYSAVQKLVNAAPKPATVAEGKACATAHASGPQAAAADAAPAVAVAAAPSAAAPDEATRVAEGAATPGKGSAAEGRRDAAHEVGREATANGSAAPANGAASAGTASVRTAVSKRSRCYLSRGWPFMGTRLLLVPLVLAHGACALSTFRPRFGWHVDGGQRLLVLVVLVLEQLLVV